MTNDSVTFVAFKIERKANNKNPKETRESLSKKASFSSLALNIKGIMRKEIILNMLIKKYCIAILSNRSNQYIYIDIVKSIRYPLAKFSLDNIHEI